MAAGAEAIIAKLKRQRFDRQQESGGEATFPWQTLLVTDYDRIAQIIRYLDENHIEQPDLEALAARAKLSQFYFHRLFSSWAGVTPKDFLQCLTVSHAKELLRNGNNALEVSFESGLSGPGRLHDLCVNLEAASPGEIKSGGSGWTIQFGFAESPFGRCLMAESPRGICHLSFVEDKTDESELAALRKDWPMAKFRRDDSIARRLVENIFVRPDQLKSQRSLRACVRGTAFQVRVWRALLKVQPGKLTSYGRLAEDIGQPSAARAVGSAVGKNPLAYLIPCHRVIRETGIVGDYRWGHVRKRAILGWETSHGSINNTAKALSVGA